MVQEVIHFNKQHFSESYALEEASLFRTNTRQHFSGSYALEEAFLFRTNTRQHFSGSYALEVASLFRTNTQHFSQDYASEEASLFRKQPFSERSAFCAPNLAKFCSTVSTKTGHCFYKSAKCVDHLCFSFTFICPLLKLVCGKVVQKFWRLAPTCKQVT